MRAALIWLIVCAGLSAPAWAEDDVPGVVRKLPSQQDLEAKDGSPLVVADELRPARLALLDVPGIEGLFASCPADIWKSRVTLRAFLATPVASEEACAADRAGCVEACTLRDDGAACLYLGLALETSGSDADAVFGRRYHALACALGEASGCTNRGGGIRNVPLPDDPLSNAPEAERFACLFPTFAASCGAGDAWGCTMAGQTHANGEGTRPDARIARRHYDRACTLSGDPEFAACAYARSLALDLDLTPRPDGE